MHLQPQTPAQQGDQAPAKGSKADMPLRLSDLIRWQQAALRAQAGAPDPIKRPAECLHDARKRSRLAQPQAPAQVTSSEQHRSCCVSGLVPALRFPPHQSAPLGPGECLWPFHHSNVLISTLSAHKDE